MRYRELQEGAAARWQSLQQSSYVLIGTATCGWAAGALDTLDAFRHEVERRDLSVPLIEVGCMGLCYAEPLVVISYDSFRVVYPNISSQQVPRLVESHLVAGDPCLELALGTLELDENGAPSIPELPRFEHELRLILRHCGIIDPGDIDHYIANGGYAALDKALRMAPEEIIRHVERAGLRGRGGAGFPTARKWRGCREASGDPKYIVCNADEGDPGAFMDREVMEGDPHQIIEGMVIAGHAVGASEGYIYVRAEYPLAIKRMRIALQQAAARGLLGDDILGTGGGFHIQIAAGAGAFVSGEETALIAAIEGEMSEPRPRPPYPSTAGLWNKPTVVNNVKTFSYVPLILERGPNWFASIGTPGNTGTVVFTLAGKVNYIGLTEVPMGTTLQTIIDDIAGGVRGNRQVKGVQIGGPSGGCLPQSLLQTSIDYDALRQAGSMIGSGGMIIMDQDDCPVDAARFFLDFTTHESCGKCTPCRLGTVQMLRILEDISTGEATLQDVDLLQDLAEDVQHSSLCGLGRTAPNPVLTTLRYFQDEYEAHIRDKTCPAKVCLNLTAYFIVDEKCDRACEHCVLTCPTEAIKGGAGKAKHIDQAKCVNCGTCLAVCPPEYDAVVKLSPITELPPEDTAAKERGIAQGVC